ncbi:uncharacterized protein KZ484_000879, partial [Pholidichthys leucotaenia]
MKLCALHSSQTFSPRHPCCCGFSLEGFSSPPSVVSAMDQDPEDRVRPSKRLRRDHEVQTKGQRSEQHTGPGPGPGPGPSCVSIRSDRSKDFFIDFSRDHDDPAQ